jgi:amidase
MVAKPKWGACLISGLLGPSVLPAQTAPVIPSAYYRTFSHTNPVLKRIKPGDVIDTKTIDATARDFKDVVRHPEPGNPLTGPFFIEGAEPGDAIFVHLNKVRLNRNWGWTAFRLGLYSLLPDAIEGIYPNRYKQDFPIPGRSDRVRWDIDVQRNVVELRDPMSKVVKLRFPAVPMLGCIGTAAPGDFSPTSAPAGSYGGNLDYNEVQEGATVILPVYHPGALLYVGDGHALQGDGEATGNGIETSMDVEFSVSLRKKMPLTGPRVENENYIISVGAQPEFVTALDHALQMATTDMVQWLTTEYRLEPWAAHLLISMQAKYDVITVAGSMGLRIPKKYLPAGR